MGVAGDERPADLRPLIHGPAGVRAFLLAIAVTAALSAGGCANSPEMRQLLENVNQTLTTIAVLKKGLD